MSKIEYEFERLAYFMGCYYHNDWSHDVGSINDRDLWEYFYKSERISSDYELETDIAGLLSRNDAEIHKILTHYQSSGRFWETPKDAKNWLLELYDFVYAKTT